MEKNKRINYLYLFILILLILVIFGIMFLVSSPTLNPAKNIADKFQITPSWESIKDYLFYDAFKPGMTHEEVHAILDKVGSWQVDLADPPNQGGWDPDTNQLTFREVIRFTQDNISGPLGDWVFWYAKDNRLVHFEPIDPY